MEEYDIDIEYDTLLYIEKKLKNIENDIESSSERMKAAINRAQDFLAGKQFEKAKNTTTNCLETTKHTQSNLVNAEKYIVKLRDIIEEYSKLEYTGD